MNKILGLLLTIPLLTLIWFGRLYFIAAVIVIIGAILGISTLFLFLWGISKLLE